MTSTTNAPIGLAALEARLRQDLQWLDLPAKPWVKPRYQEGKALLDVAIVGGGMAGLALATELLHMGVTVVLFDKAEEGLEGPWSTTARMETLRSPKQLTGPALGLPALTFRAWYEAQFGTSAWEALDKIPRLQWAQYLRWYRRVIDLDVRNRQRVLAVQPQADGWVRLRVEGPQGEHEVSARHVVLATGRDGLGGPWVPPLADQLPREQWAHSADGLQGAWFVGKRVAVIGGGASAMDAAATALEAGAERVDLLIRREQLPRINKGKGAGSPGMTHGYWRLSDQWKWRIRHYLNAQQVPPPKGSTLRVAQHANARFLLGRSIEAVSRNQDGSVRVSLIDGKVDYDFLVFATGFSNDMTRRPEFASLAPHVRSWAQRLAGQQLPIDPGAQAELGELPDLGLAFEFQQAQPNGCPGLEQVHCFCYPAALSYGGVSGDIPAISDGAKRLAQALAGALFVEDIDQHFSAMQDYAEPELQGDEWLPGELTAEERER
ncbi:FAD-dependent oxidoreductase [Pseudomonas cichorii]|uniref:FAD-dependent oxidoreductase n=1 Tax=Pseudomonas cichorii TaxID=36746 RepID=UPI00190FDB39|nr:NAD(P)/FAD-dependent oxidoreductase [Pseudomonas cichorii]GFM79952.1 FAD-dependent oxidoreductase [Pseudomonas cichorii]